MLRQVIVVTVLLVVAGARKEKYDRVLNAVRSQEDLIPVTSSPLDMFSFLTYDEINTYLNTLASSYPDIVTVGSIGNSYEDRPLSIIKISSGGEGTRPLILIDAGIHGNEWLTPVTAVHIINQLVENEDNKDLIASVDWHIIPSINPDGYEHSQYPVNYADWRKTRSKLNGSSCIGVDANNNFDFHWNEVGASDDPCSIVYAGPEPFSEPETRALRDYILENKNRIQLYLTLHGAAHAFLYPWGYTTELPDDWETLHSLAQRANEAQIAAGGSNFTIGTPINSIYGAVSGSADWVKDVAGVALSYTVELGGEDIWPAKWDIEPAVTQFFSAVRVFGEYVAEINRQ